jgi:hypothetical protein
MILPPKIFFQNWHQNDQQQSLFVEWIIKNNFFINMYLIPFFCRRLLRPAGATFLKNGSLKTQMGNPRYDAARDISSKFSIFLPPEPFT